MGAEIIGMKLELKWLLNSAGFEAERGERTKAHWLRAKCTAYSAGKHTIEYECDDDVEELDLLNAQRDWRLV